MSKKEWPRKVVAPICATVLAAVVLTTLPAEQIGGGSAGQPPGPDVDKVIEDYENGKIQEQAEEASAQVGLIPAGDTCLMRHVNLARNVDRDFRRSFAAIQLESNAAAARTALVTLKQRYPDQNPLVAWRLELESARMAIRAGDIDAARQILTALSDAQNIPAICQSDTYFHLALLTHGPDTYRLLEKAAELDPVALQVQEARLAHQLRSRPTDSNNCAGQVAAQIKSIVFLKSLVRSDRELFRLEALALSSPKGAVKDLMLGLLAEQRSDTDAARIAFERSLNHAPSSCDSEARYLAKRRLDALEELS